MRKYSPFSIDTILASEGRRYAENAARDSAALIGDVDRGPSNSLSAEDSRLRQLFTDFTCRFRAAHLGRSLLTFHEEEPDSEMEQFADDISTLFKRHNVRPQRFILSILTPITTTDVLLQQLHDTFPPQSSLI